MNPMDKMRAIAATALIAGPMPEFETEKHAPIQGRVVGWSLVKPREKHGRNEPCHCGSGLKFKKCCVNKPLRESKTPIATEGSNHEN